jgi:dihydrofolate reductase
MVFKDFDTAIMSLGQDLNVNEVFVIGGNSLYELAMNQYKDYCKCIIATRINKKFECDTFIPSLEKNEDFSPIHVSKTYSQDDITYDYTFFGNNQILGEQPELIPTKLIEKYPKHAEF